MWKTAAKLLIVLFLRNRMTQVTNSFGAQFSEVKENIAVMAESRAAIFKRNFDNDLHRVVNSLLGYMFMLLALACSALIGLMWLFATAWSSPHRDIILGIAMILPLLIGIVVFVTIKNSWKNDPLFSRSLKQIETDWLVFRGGLNGTVDSANEANK